MGKYNNSNIKKKQKQYIKLNTSYQKQKNKSDNQTIDIF